MSLTTCLIFQDQTNVRIAALVPSDYLKRRPDETSKLAIINWLAIGTWICLMVIFLRVVIDVFKVLKKRLWR